MADERNALDALVRHPDGSVERLGADRLDEIDTLVAREGALVWASARDPSPADLEILAREFELHPLAVEDLRKRAQRPKIDAYARQHMLVVYEAIDGTDLAGIGLSEIHAFIGTGWLLSVTWADTPMVDAVRDRFTASPDRVGANVGELLYAVLDAAVDSYFPELDRLSERIDDLEDRVLEGTGGQESLREVLAIKRRLLELRRVLAPMRDVANQLLRRDLDVADASVMPYYQDLYDHLVRVLDQLDIYRDLLATVLDARLTVASNSLNAIMKRLTAITVALMVPTLVAGVYGMNFDLMPELRWPLGYPFALGLMVLAVVLTIVFFRRRGWF